MKACTQLYPRAYEQTGEGHWCSCWLYHPKALSAVNPITGQGVVRHE